MSFEIKPAIKIQDVVNNLIAPLTNGAPGSLDTLYEIANSLSNDPNFAVNTNNSISNLQSQVNNNYNNLSSLIYNNYTAINSLNANALTQASLTNTQLVSPTIKNPTINYAEDILVAASSSGVISYSQDGINWSSVSIGLGGLYQPVKTSTGYFVNQQGPGYAYSTNGTTWTTGSLGSDLGSGQWRRPAYGGGTLVTVIGVDNNDNSYSSNQGKYSTNNGITWNTMNLPGTYGWTAPVYGNGKFVIASLNGGVLAYSSNGIDWNQVNIASRRWNNIGFANNRFFLVAQNGPGSQTYYYSTDGVNWNQGNFPYADRNYWTPVLYAYGKYFAFPDLMSVFYSTDGISWSEAYVGGLYGYRYTYLNGKILAFNPDYWSYYAYTSDGLNWNASQPFPNTSRGVSMYYAFGLYFYATNGVIYYSTNASTWSAYSQSSLVASRGLSTEVITSISAKEISYLKNAISNLQAQIDAL